MSQRKQTAPRKRRVSRENVAAAAGISGATVSYVLNNRRDVKIPDATRSRVLEAARRLGYTVNRNARNLVSGKTRTLGVIIGNPQMDSFAANLLTGIEKECARRNYSLLLALGGSQADVLREQTRLYVEHRVDGIVLFSDCHSPENKGWYEGAVRQEVPMVLLDQRLKMEEQGIDCVFSDDVSGAQAMTQHLIDLGHRRIVHLAGSPDRTTAEDRRRGWEQALTQAGMPPAPEDIIGETWDLEASYTALQKRFDQARGNWPTAIFAANDFLATGVYRLATQRGLRIPDDLSIAAYGNQEISLGMGLTSADQKTEIMGRAAVDCVLSRADTPATPMQQITTPVELCLRESTAAPSLKEQDA